MVCENREAGDESTRGEAAAVLEAAGAAGVESKRPRMSLTELFGGGAAEVAF